MFRTRRLLVVAVLFGVGLAAVTFLGAARLGKGDAAGESSSASGDPKAPAVSAAPKGLWCLGTADRDPRHVGLFPPTVPLPSKVVEVRVNEGATVEENQPLLDVDMVVDKAQAKLNVEKAQAAVEEAEALVAQARQAEKAHEFAILVQKEVVEARRLEVASKQIAIPELERSFKLGTSTREQLDSAREGIKALEAAAAAEEKKLLGLEQIKPTTKVEQALAARRRVKLELQAAQQALKPMTLTAPAAGTILRVNVGKGSTFGPQTREPAFLFQPNGKVIVRAEVEQEFAHIVQKDMRATVYDYANSGLTWKGRVVRVADAFLPKRSISGGPELLSSGDSNAVLECVVEVEMDAGSPPLRIGQRVRVSLGE